MVLFPVRLKCIACFPHRDHVNTGWKRLQCMSFHMKTDHKLGREESHQGRETNGEVYYVAMSSYGVESQRGHLRVKIKNKCIKKCWVILTKDTQAASSRILTRRSSNCSTTSSHRDLPEMRQIHHPPSCRTLDLKRPVSKSLMCNNGKYVDD